MSQEQRRHPRIATRKKIWCEGQESPVVAAETRDISKSGMFIVVEKAPRIGQQLQVRFDDEGNDISLQMEVMWHGPKTAENQTGIGVRIVSFDKGHDVYERFLARHMKGENVRPSWNPPFKNDPDGSDSG